MSYQEAVDFFKAADTDGSGSLSYKELRTVLKEMGYSSKDAKRFFELCDTSGDKIVSLDEFVAAIVNPELSSKEALLRRTFMEFDKDGNGEIDRAELGEVFKELGSHLTEEALKEMIALCDDDNSGTINYEEFIKQCDFL